MTDREPPRAAVLGAVLAWKFSETSAYRIGVAVDALQIAASRARAFELRCLNEPMTKKQQGAARSRLNKAIRRAEACLIACQPEGKAVPLNCMGVTLEFGGDARGHCGWIHVEGEPGDGMHGGFAIYR